MRRRLGSGLASALLGGAAAVVGIGSAPAPARAASVPAGFTDVEVASVPNPTAVEVLPDGRLVVLDQGGKVRILQGGALLATPALTLPVCGGGGSEMGLLGFATGNDFTTDGRVFVYYTAPVTGGCVNRVSAFTMSGNTIDPGSEAVLLDNIPGTVTDPAGNHNGGDLEVGQDGNLYVAIGDSGRDPRGDSGAAGDNDAAQDLSILSGKIVRITTDGGIPAGNPFQGAGTTRCATAGIATATGLKCREIFAYGLRNPYRFAFDPNQGATRFLINDVGQGTREEVNEGAVGANYGWNMREGPCPRGQNPPCPGPSAGLVDPLTSYGRADGCTYITGGAFVPDGLWPEAFDGAYLFADGGCGKIFVRTRDGGVDYGRPFASGAGQITDMVFAPDVGGVALYYTQNGQGKLRRVTFTGSAPAAPVGGLVLAPVEPRRVYDTRNGIGTTPGLMRAATSRVVDVHPPDASARAVLVNVTYAGARGEGFAQAWPTHTRRPTTSILNASGPGEVVANSAVLPISAAGTVLVSTSVTTDLLVDVLGYFVTPGGAPGGEYRAVAPVRLIDQRRPAGSPLGSGSNNPYQQVGEHIDVQVSGQVGIPDDGSASAVAIILTALGSGTPVSGYATAYPSGATRPDASNVNTSGQGDVRANLAIVPIGANGRISLYGFDVSALLVDVAGWFTSGAVPVTGAGLLTVTPSQRVVDSRGPAPTGFGPIPAGQTRSLNLAPPVPAAATAVVQNLTVASTGGWGFVSSLPEGAAGPSTSNLNFTGAEQTRAALAITARTPGGPMALPVSQRTAYYSSADTQLIVDLYGYFV